MQIIQAFIDLLGEEYMVINKYNNQDQISLDGVLAVAIDKIQLLHHGNTKDNKTTVGITGHTFTAQDLSQQRINEMFNYVFELLDVDTIVNAIDDCAGAVINGGEISSDGDQNMFTIEVDLYRCID